MIRMQSTTHRLFVALNFDEPTKKLIADYALAIRPIFQVRSPTWVNPAIFHLTLYFFGEVDEAGLKAITAQFDTLEGALQAPTLVSQGQSFLPNKRNPRTLCISFAVAPAAPRELNQARESNQARHSSQSIDSIVATSRLVAKTIGLTPDFRPWTPHLTLARFKNDRRFGNDRRADPHVEPMSGTSVEPRSASASGHSALPEPNDDPPAPPHIVYRPKTFDLMESELFSNGPRYTIVRAYSFAP